MLISTKHLKAAGLDVTVSEDGYTTGHDYLVEINFPGGHRLSDEIANELDDAVGPEFGPAVFESLAHKIHGIQVMEAIRKTEGKAWRDRHGKGNGKGKK